MPKRRIYVFAFIDRGHSYETQYGLLLLSVYPSHADQCLMLHVPRGISREEVEDAGADDGEETHQTHDVVAEREVQNARERVPEGLRQIQRHFAEGHHRGSKVGCLLQR